MTILVIDFMNACHRARSGFKLGPAPVVFNFFRQMKSLIDRFSPNRVYVALEGRPVKRHETLTQYKANRVVTQEDPKAAELEKFYEQKNIIVNLLTRYFPVSVIRHPMSEADDTIANVIRRSSTAVEWIIVSSDSDFIQLLQNHDNVKLFNPVKDQFVVAPAEYHYLTWKALRGDPSDNIPGIPRCGDKTAARIAATVGTQEFSDYLSLSDNAAIFERNYSLIEFTEWSEEERIQMTSSQPSKDWDAVKHSFECYGFGSIVGPASWHKFVASFDNLWGD